MPLNSLFKSPVWEYYIQTHTYLSCTISLRSGCYLFFWGGGGFCPQEYCLILIFLCKLADICSCLKFMNNTYWSHTGNLENVSCCIFFLRHPVEAFTFSHESWEWTEERGFSLSLYTQGDKQSHSFVKHIVPELLAFHESEASKV